MATVSQPGSRGGLITALVIFVILFLVSAIFAVMKTSELKKKEEDLTRFRSQYTKVVTDPQLSIAQQDADKYISQTPGTDSVYSALVKQREELSVAIAGKAMPTKDSLDMAAKTVAQANDVLKPAGVAVPGGALTSAVSSLAQSVVQRQGLVNDLKGQLAAANSARQADAEACQKQAGELEKAIAAAKQEVAAKTAELEKYRTEKDAKVTDLETTTTKSIEDNRKVIEGLQAQLASAKAEYDKLTKDNDKLVKRIAQLRPRNYADAIMRQPDGKIIQIGRNNTVYIDLGYGDRITQGMTFQIYDKLEGIPRLDGGTDDLPPGKGSLEVVRVDAGSSECRIIHMDPGQSPQEGDIVANLIYDKHLQLKFKVYGDFDLDHNGVATAADADVIKRLIVQWGGQITDKTDIDTDFVVMGKEPTLPDVNRADLEQDPVAKFEYENKVKALKAYDDVRNRAIELQIPVLNQNRFLYMIGYWDQGRK